jgi:putative flippase GtrA
MSRETFRYGACGAANMVLDLVLYYLIYHYIVAERFIDLGVVIMSPHIASLCVVFPITFFNGFWLNRNVAFRRSTLPQGRQLWRYALSVGGSILLNYVCMKLLVEQAGVWATPAKAITTVISVAYSYLAARYYSFRTNSSGE